ncbi:MAG: response regulator [Polyangiaceae bacterium]
MKILIVDDSKAMRMIVRRSLRQAGYGDDVEEASSAQEALETLKKQTSDLVLCDWNMPGMTGIALLEQLRAQHSKVRFGFITSEGSEEMRKRAADAGALFLLAKPFSSESLEAALKSVGRN